MTAETVLAVAAAVAGTLIVYLGALRLYRRAGTVLLNPVLVSIVVIVGALSLTGIGYEPYHRGGTMLSFFLGPAVVALAIPLHAQLPLIRRNARALLLSLLAGSAVGVLAATLPALALGGSGQVVRSLAPRAVTTPIAIGIAERLGGIAPLAAAVVIATGVVGAVLGPPLLRTLGVRSRAARGLALGAAAHGIGTARAVEEGEVEAASAGLAIGIMGVLTALLAPLLIAALAAAGWLS
jgi:predicted murein hydrolase (TIGR00659 family)